MKNKTAKKAQAKVQNILGKISVGPIGNFANKVQRGLRSKRKIAQPKSAKVPRPELPSLSISRKLMLYLIGGIFVGVLALAITLYFSITPRRSPLDNVATPDTLVGNKASILLIATERIGEYDFIEGIGLLVVSFDGKSHKLVMINPDITSRILGTNPVKLRNMFGNALNSDKDPIDTLSKGLESILGVNIDRYITIDLADLRDIFLRNEIDFIASDSISDPDTEPVVQGQAVGGEFLISYLGADAAGINAKLTRQVDFMKQKLGSISNFSLITQLGWLNSVFGSSRTNLSREEVVRVALGLINNKQLDTTFIRKESTAYEPDPLGGEYAPIVSLIDEEIKKIFTRIEVAQEQGRIEVYNATSTSGLATSHKRLLENLGANVVRAGNFPQQEQRSKLYAPRLADFPQTIGAIREVLKDKVIILDEEYPSNHVGEMILILGADSVEN